MGHSQVQYHPVLGGKCQKCEGSGEVDRSIFAFVSPGLADSRERSGNQKKRCRHCGGTGRAVIERRKCHGCSEYDDR
jgi:hypothetical protein